MQWNVLKDSFSGQISGSDWEIIKIGAPQGVKKLKLHNFSNDTSTDKF